MSSVAIDTTANSSELPLFPSLKYGSRLLLPTLKRLPVGTEGQAGGDGEYGRVLHHDRRPGIPD